MDRVVLTAAVLYAIVLLRAGGTFAVGWLAGAGARRSRLAGRISSAKFQRVERAIQRWGAPVVAVSFLTVGFQTAANFLAGSMRMPLSRYLPALFVGGAAWALVYATVGLEVFEILAKLFAERTATGMAVTAALLLAAGCGAIYRGRRRRGTRPDG
ncbi:DedA family protein [Streptomyces sp. O3]